MNVGRSAGGVNDVLLRLVRGGKAAEAGGVEREGRSDRSGLAYRLRLFVVDMDVPVWRGVEVRGDMSLRSLNRVVRRSFGWREDHEYGLNVRHGWDGTMRGIIYRRVRVCDVAEAGDILTLRYAYSGREVDVLVEGLREGPVKGLPVCLSGRGSCAAEPDLPLLLTHARRPAWLAAVAAEVAREAGAPIDIDHINANLRCGRYPRLEESEVHERFRRERRRHDRGPRGDRAGR